MKHNTGPIAWMAKNRVAANLAMLILLVGGLIMGSRLKQEIFPSMEIPWVNVWVSYPGATPSEVEKGITLAAEEAVQTLDNVKNVYSGSMEGGAWLSVELQSGSNGDKGLDKIQKAIDQISFPDGAKQPHISLYKMRDEILSMMLYGDVPESYLLEFADEMRDELLQRPHISSVEVSGVSGKQISVEVSQETLRRYNLSPQTIAEKLKTTSQQFATGKIKSSGEELLLTTEDPRNHAALYQDVPIYSHAGGSSLRLGDIAKVQEEPFDSRRETLFNGKPAACLTVFRMGNHTPIQVSNSAKAYVEELKTRLPEGVSVSIWSDDSEIFKDRINLLGRNALMGLALVLLLLGLFLDLRLAFWVTMGIPISVIGSLMFLPAAGATINMISLFAFIITLGIVVDDALVVGEIVHQKREEGLNALEAAIAGAKEIATPVTCAVLTNIATFTPLFFIPGPVGQIYRQIPAVVVAVFSISLIESLFILPAHLSHEPKKKGLIYWLNEKRSFLDTSFHKFVDRFYTPALKKCLRYKYATLAASFGMLMISIGCVLGGYISYSYMPKMEDKFVKVKATIPFGTSIEDAEIAAQNLNASGSKVMEALGPNNFDGIHTTISPIFAGDRGPSGSFSITLQLNLTSEHDTTITASKVATLWREHAATIPGLQTLSFDTERNPQKIKPISIKLSHRSTAQLKEAAKHLAKQLATYEGVTDIEDGTTGSKPQLALELREEAKGLGITPQTIAAQVYSSFSGTEALKERRGRHELPVVVRLPKKERETLHTLEQMILNTPSGGYIALRDVANLKQGYSENTINRENGRRSISVTAEVENGTNSGKIISDLEQTVALEMTDLYPGLKWNTSGQHRETQDVQGALFSGFLLALIAVYALLAIPFQSYLQPIIVMLSIPFGIVGAFIGHFLLGYELSIISILGIIALSGVVVNDSLVLVVTANRLRDEGTLSSVDALAKASASRFRPIILTSLTTFFGLMPMIFETSLQARFLIPMAISLGFGILFSTGIILFLCPATYLILSRFGPKAQQPAKLQG